MPATCTNEKFLFNTLFAHLLKKQLIEFGVKFPGAETGGGISLWQRIQAFFK
jgi:hypothetical protein